MKTVNAVLLTAALTAVVVYGATLSSIGSCKPFQVPCYKWDPVSQKFDCRCEYFWCRNEYKLGSCPVIPK